MKKQKKCIYTPVEVLIFLLAEFKKDNSSFKRVNNNKMYGQIIKPVIIFDTDKLLGEEGTPSLKVKSPAYYSQLGIEKGLSIYSIFEKDPEAFLYVPEPQRMRKSGLISPHRELNQCYYEFFEEPSGAGLIQTGN